MQMHISHSLLLSLLFGSTLAFAQRAIECESFTKQSNVLPSIYLNKTGQLCFDVLGWSEYQGQNCIKNGQSINWKATVPIYERDQIHDREPTQFRVVSPKVSDERLDYAVEWRRAGEWQLLQRIGINRITGSGVISSKNGGEPIKCSVVSKKI
jgi:hypothetical protein